MNLKYVKLNTYRSVGCPVRDLIIYCEASFNLPYNVTNATPTQENLPHVDKTQNIVVDI
jgi:hypothetical protein